MLTRANNKNIVNFPPSENRESNEFEKYSFFTKTIIEKERLKSVLASKRLVIGGEALSNEDTISYLVRAI